MPIYGNKLNKGERGKFYDNHKYISSEEKAARE